MRLLIALVVAAAIPISYRHSSRAWRSTGPFAIGHTWFVVTDTRPDPSDDVVRGTRPINVNVWYPVDAADVTGRTPDWLYPFNRFTSPVSFLLTTSADWERPCESLPPPPAGQDLPLCEGARLRLLRAATGESWLRCRRVRTSP